MENNGTVQVADPAVSKIKFFAEIDKFKIVEEQYKRKGVLCTKLDYPDAYFIFGIPKLTPYPIVFSVRINFTNYDVEPPSVTFINPFTNEQLRREQIPIHFIQFNPNNFQPQDLLQGVGNIYPFFCIPGIKEYHDHPAHSGDSWFLYRTKGEGGILFILDQLYNHSIPYVKQYQAVVNLPAIQVQQEFTIQAPINIPINLIQK